MAKTKALDILIEEMGGGIWVAALERGRLEGLEFDPPEEEVRWGSIYWAKVARIDKAQDAVFVNLDGDNIGILYNADIRIVQDDGTYKKGGDVEIGKMLRPGQMIAVQAKSAFMPSVDEPYAKAGVKAPRVSMNITLPGRYLILSPTDPENRISRRIRDKDLRQALQDMLRDLKECTGCIMRAAAANTQTDVLMREARILSNMWTQLQDHFNGDSPQLIMDGPDAIQRTLSDKAVKNIHRIEITTMDHFALVEEWCDLFAPDLMTRITPVEVDNPESEFALFEHHDITGQIEDLFQPYAILDSGATIILQETAALYAIDVNSAADKRGALAINLDAAAEIARQIRLRNLGGAIIIDFLRMKKKAERDQLVKALEQAFNEDPCTVQIHGWTGLGMLEVSRNRRMPPLQDRLDATIA